jgi:DNA-binding MarR family transcriptional regulator
MAKKTSLPTENGWVKLHRKIRDKGWYLDSEYVHLYIHIHLKANHSIGEFLQNGEIVKLKAGQFVTGRKQLSIETGVSESKVERVLKCFEKDGVIEQQTNSRNRLISILSWETEQIGEQQTNSTRTANGQQMDTNNKNKEDKEELIIYSHWIDEFIQTKLKQVPKMTVQMDFEEMVEIEKTFKDEWIKKKLEAMDNKPKLTKDYVKVGATLKNWLAREGEAALKESFSKYEALKEYNKGYHDKMFG